MEFAVGETQRLRADVEEINLTGFKCPMSALLTRDTLRRSMQENLNEKGARRLLIRRGPL